MTVSMKTPTNVTQSIMDLIETHSIMAFSIKIHNIINFITRQRITVFSMMTLSLMTFSILKPSIKI